MVVDLSKLKLLPVSFVVASNKDTASIEAEIKKLIGNYGDIIIIKNPDNLYEAYDQGWKKARNETIVFCHDDVHFNWDEGWYQRLKPLIEHELTGFIGIAGSKGLLTTGFWAEGFQKHEREHLLGKVTHGKIVDGKYKETVAAYGGYGQAVVLDGVVLITKKSVLKAISGFGKEVYGSFHFYDISTTFRAHLAGYNNYVVELPTVHMSTGVFNEDWHKARDKFVEKYRDKLPAVINAFPQHEKVKDGQLRVLCGMAAGDGCSYYRIKNPFNKLKELKLMEALYWEPFSRDHSAKDQEVLYWTDIFLVRDGHGGLMKRIQLNFEGKKFIYDADDNEFEMSPYNDHFGGFATDDFWHKNDKGEEIPVWIDEEHPNLVELKAKWPGLRTYGRKKNIARFEELLWMLKECSAITVTTEELAKIYRPYNPNVYVLPNAIDFNRWMKVDLKKGKEIRIGWSGGASHYADLLLLKNWLPKFLQAHKNCKFVILGSALGGWIKDLPENQVEIHKWETTEAYPFKMALLNLDIGLVPLESNNFNKCKSPIKYLEMSALGVPCLLSNCTPYREVVKDGATGLLFTTRKEFLNKLTCLVEDSVYRKKIGDAARNYVYENHNMDKVAEDYLKVYQKVREE